MKIQNKANFQFIFFLSFLVLLNFFQSWLTKLFEDEAYYWVWSQDLAFGYFDHPPLVALWVKLSGFFFDGELGVRFFSVISFTVFLVFVWKLIENRRKSEFVWLYFTLVFGVAFLQVFGFITTPDTPLLMFSAIFFYFYKKFLISESWKNILGLAFAMAGMLYSKYHGILVIGFIALSNLKLLVNIRFWYACLLTLLLYFPHLYWQYLNDFPSFKYHLLERAKKPYNLGKTLLHFVNQIAIVGVTFPIIYAAFFRQKPNSEFERSLKFVWYGFFIFFLLSTFKSEPQAQWTIVALIPIVVITFNHFIDHPKARKWLIILTSINFLVIIVGRIFLMNSSISPVPLEPHWSEEWIPKVHEKAEKRPVVFVNSYRSASLYRFYTGIQTHSYSILKGRKSQYDLNDFEQKMQQKEVVAIGSLINGEPWVKKQPSDDKFMNAVFIDNYRTFQKVSFEIEKKELEFTLGKRDSIQFEVFNPYLHEIHLSDANFFLVFQGEKNRILQKIPLKLFSLPALNPKEKVALSADFLVPDSLESNNLSCRIALGFYNLPEGFQGNKVPVKLVE